MIGICLLDIHGRLVDRICSYWIKQAARLCYNSSWTGCPLTSSNLICTCKPLMALLLPKLCNCCYCDCDAKSCANVEFSSIHDRISIHTCLHYGQHDRTECSSPTVVDHICNTWISGTICLNIRQLFQNQVVCPRIRQSDFCWVFSILRLSSFTMHICVTLRIVNKSLST